MVQKWEYKFVYSIGEAEANGLGDEGWELVSADSQASISSGSEYIFKRPKSALDDIEDKLSESFS